MDGIWVQGDALPDGMCYGCGPANSSGLGLKSYSDGETVVATWQPEPIHVAGGGFLCGGVIGTLLDCHTGGAVWWWVRQQHGEWPADSLTSGSLGGPIYLTSSYEIRLLRPTPLDTPVELHAEIAEHREPELTVTGHMLTGGKRSAEITASWRRFQPRR